MAEYKLVLADPKTGKSYQKEAKDDVAKSFLGKKIGDTIKGEVIEMTGYEFQITGGSDYCGFPMRGDFPGVGRKRLLLAGGIGYKSKEKGIRRRKTICGNTIFEKTAQISLKITKYGKEPLEKPAEAPADAPEKTA